MFWSVVRWWCTKNKETQVRKVIAFYPDGGFEYFKWQSEAFSGAGWEALGCDRLEFRILQKGKKRRVVLYPGTACDPTFPEPPKCVVINARLIPRKESGATAMDVTGRVQKYMGNTLKSVHHMFPFDDHDDNAARFEMVRIIDLSMKVTDVYIT